MAVNLQQVINDMAEKMQCDMTANYFRSIGEIHARMLKRELSNPVIDPMAPVSGAKYARFVEYGAPKPPHPIARH